MSKRTIALCGNPNSGKTTLFNRLTGANQKIGNWAGVTVERKSGIYRKNADVEVIDTPGAYSLFPYSPEEKITADYVTGGEPDVIINVVDATNLERNLLLTTQLLERSLPVVVALNLKDEAESKGISVNPDLLGQLLGCKVFYISAAKNDGVDEMMEYCARPLPQNTPPRFPSDTAERYAKISDIAAVVRKTNESKHDDFDRLTSAIDKIVLNKWLAFPIFFAVMGGIFYLSVGSVGKWLTELINGKLTPLLQQWVTALLADAHSPALTSLFCDGIIGGVMSVASFVPQIMLLFGCIAVLEASGYMSRIAFITDRALHKIGLGGRSFVAIVLGCGCSVPAVMSTRTIKNAAERDATITLAPFAPCSAKLAVISFFTAKIFNGSALFAVSFYVVSIAAIVAGGLILKTFKKDDDCDAFLMELPSYRKPAATNVLKQMWERGKAFLVKAGTVIFVSSVLLWALQRLGALELLGKAIAPLFAPLGFDDGGYGRQFSVATLTGIVAKETVVTTLEILLPASVEQCISQLGAYCFVVYNLLTAPCVATISASFTELGGWKKCLKALTFQIVLAYVTTLVIYQVGSLCLRHRQAAVIALSAIAFVAALTVATVCLFKRRKCSGNCENCIRKNVRRG